MANPTWFLVALSIFWNLLPPVSFDVPGILFLELRLSLLRFLDLTYFSNRLLLDPEPEEREERLPDEPEELRLPDEPEELRLPDEPEELRQPEEQEDPDDLDDFDDFEDFELRLLLLFEARFLLAVDFFFCSRFLERSFFFAILFFELFFPPLEDLEDFDNLLDFPDFDEEPRLLLDRLDLPDDLPDDLLDSLLDFPDLEGWASDWDRVSSLLSSSLFVV